MKTFFARYFKCDDVYNKNRLSWQMFLHDFGPWQTLYFYFRKWKLEVVFK